MVYWNVKKHGVHWVTHRYLHVSDQVLSGLESVWYMCLKTENCCLKIFVEILWVKKCVKLREILFKNWKWLFENTNQTPPYYLNAELGCQQPFLFLDRTRDSGEKDLSIGTSVMYLRLKFYELGVPCIIIPRALYMFIPSHTG